MPRPDACTASEILAQLRRLVGRSHVLTSQRSTKPFRTGFRHGQGSALAVVQPGNLSELWQVTRSCIEAGRIVIPQAANTGLTGGSTPHGIDYDREVVIISTRRITGVQLINGGQEVICLAGTTLNQLERALSVVGRDPHSVIGSSCIGASVVGGVCNNSGGALIRRGPAYTEMALYAQADASGTLTLVNHLGIELGTEPEAMLERLERGQYSATGADHPEHKCGSDRAYASRVRDIDSSVPARFNADPRRLHEAAGCAGRVMVFAVRLDTFPKDEKTAVFYIGTNDPDDLALLRQHALATFGHLPVSAEYLHRDAFDVAERYGKDTYYAIQMIDTDRLPGFFRAKAWLDSIGVPTDRILQFIGGLLPRHVPVRLKDFRDRFEHHLIVRAADGGIDEIRDYLRRTSVGATAGRDYFECTPNESTKALLLRFVVAGAALRYAALRPDLIEDIVALDIALPRNAQQWIDGLPKDLASQMHSAIYYGHYFCHVFHQDYLVRKGCNVAAVKQALLGHLGARGARYPAEHNVGHDYRAPPELEAFYRELDPTNSFNPGIGMTTKNANWTHTE